MAAGNRAFLAIEIGYFGLWPVPSSTVLGVKIRVCRGFDGVCVPVLFGSGMTDLLPGQRVFVQAESVPRGLQATRVEPL